jgi:hypothetical protein
VVDELWLLMVRLGGVMVVGLGDAVTTALLLWSLSEKEGMF